LVVVTAFGALTPEPLPFRPTPSQARRVEVHDRRAEVRVERRVRPEVLEPADAPDERLVRQVLGLRAVAGQEVGQADPTRDVTLLELRHRPAVGFHHGPSIHDRAIRRHRTPKTREVAGR